MGKKRGGGKKRRGAPKKRRTSKRPQRRESRAGKRFVSLAVLLMLVMAAYFVVFGGEYSIFQLKRMEKMEAEAAAQLAATEAEIDSLKAAAAQLQSDPAAIERVAREQYGMIREGEILYRFREASDSAIDGSGKQE